MRRLTRFAAVSVLTVAAWAPEIASAVVGISLVVLLSQPGAPLVSGLVTLAIGLAGALAVGLAVALPAIQEHGQRDGATSRRRDVTSSTDEEVQ